MNFKELNYIHELLVNNVNNFKSEWDKTHDKKKEVGEEDANYLYFVRVCSEKYDLLKEAQEMLDAFEEYKW